MVTISEISTHNLAGVAFSVDPLLGTFTVKRVDLSPYREAKAVKQMRDVFENTTMQLNMGEEKSSVIILLVAATLADGFRLVRIITAKPQAKQMSQMQVSWLGGGSPDR